MEEIRIITFEELERKIFVLMCQYGCSILKTILEKQDRKLMQERDKKLYRHKGNRKNCIKTLMGEVEYTRAIYQVTEGKTTKHIYLLDDKIVINTIGKISYNLAEKMIDTAINTTSYRKGATEIQNLTAETISHEGLKDLVWKVGQEIEQKENEQIKLLKDEKLVKGTKKITALFEEADGLWINLQGQDRTEQLEKYRKQCERQNKKYEPLRKVKTELKLHVMHEGWKKDDKRHEVVNKTYIAGIMPPKTLEEIRNAKVYQRYNEKAINLRVMNGDGATWINNIATKDTISQKDLFHIQQAIIRNISEKEHQQELIRIIRDKKYKDVPKYIEYLKYELGGEEKTIKKLDDLKQYLKVGLPRYRDILEEQGRKLPKAPDNIEYRDMGIMESQIFTVLEVRLSSGRKSWSKKGSTYISKLCALYVETKGKIKLDNVAKEIEIDNSVEEWINAIEENVKRNEKIFRANEKLTEENNYAQCIMIEKIPEVKEILHTRTTRNNK